MTDFTTADRDVSRAIRSWLHEDRHEDVSRVAGAVLDQVDAIPQRRVTWWPARRTEPMNKILGLGLAAAAVVAAVLIGAQLLGSPDGGFGGPGEEPTPSPEASVVEPTPEAPPSSSAWTGIPEGPFVVTGSDDPVQVTLDIASPGWRHLGQFDAVDNDDDGLDPPEHAGAALLAWGWPSGTGINVYGDPCQWRTTIPEAPATTPDEIAAAFAAQALTEASAPEDVTVGGYDGKAITLRVPMSFDLPGATREEKFADCDDETYAFYGVEGEDGWARNVQGAGQVDELWILDVDGSIVILAAVYSPATPAELVEDLRTLAESASFEVP